MGDAMEDETLDMAQIFGMIQAVREEGQTEQGDHEDQVEKAQKKRSPDSLGLRPGNPSKKSRAKLTKKQVFMDQQSRAFNESGRARNQDFHMPLHESNLDRQPVRGSGKWKVWSAPAVLRAAFSAETATCRQIQSSIEGAGRNNASGSRYVAAACIMEGQNAAIEKLKQASDRVQVSDHVEVPDRVQPKLAYIIRNIMFDESTFDLLVGDVSASYSVLCSHGQLTFRFEGEDLVHDEHVFRPPAILFPGMNSATMHKALNSGPAGFSEALSGKYVATLTTSDAHAANIRLLRFVDQELEDHHFFLPSLCLQHRVGNIVEQVTKFLGVLGGNFSVAKVLNKGNLLQDLRVKATAQFARPETFRVLKETPAALVEEWSQARLQAVDLIQLCMSYDDSPVSRLDHARSGTQREAFQRLASFFNGPWTGPSFAGWAVCFAGLLVASRQLQQSCHV